MRSVLNDIYLAAGNAPKGQMVEIESLPGVPIPAKSGMRRFIFSLHLRVSR